MAGSRIANATHGAGSGEPKCAGILGVPLSLMPALAPGTMGRSDGTRKVGNGLDTRDRFICRKEKEPRLV
ncbi:hypothetical protein DXT89_21620 [Agrobacterium vitis]|nr:hypothetical protein DXM22_20550 [Agrobacterium vitis]KAA3522407.1 hypothetical protein DXT89_21620 [Agrobacterium vitis]RCU49738.1 hypothetical protein ASB66_023760 [Agrobacterium vitis]